VSDGGAAAAVTANVPQATAAAPTLAVALNDPARSSPAVIDRINLAAAAAFVWTGAADRLWRAMEPTTAWRTGPAWQATLAYFAACAFTWAALNLALFALIRRSFPLERVALRAARSVVAACAITAIQVLAPPVWPAVACAMLLPPMLLSWPQASVARRLLAWAWISAGIALSGLLVHPYFVGTPTFVPRLALCLTAWRLLAARRPLRLDPREAWTPDALP